MKTKALISCVVTTQLIRICKNTCFLMAQLIWYQKEKFASGSAIDFVTNSAVSQHFRTQVYGSPVFKHRIFPCPKTQLPRQADRLDFCIALGWGFTLQNSSNFRRRLFTSTSIRREKVCCEFVFCAFRCHTLSILYDNVAYLMQFRKPVQIQINAGENLEMHYFRRVRRSDINMPTSVAKYLATSFYR